MYSEDFNKEDFDLSGELSIDLEISIVSGLICSALVGLIGVLECCLI
jgi:hypothetical protein